jgi:hypothetical protein
VSDAGFTVRDVTATALLLRDFAAGEQLLGLRRNVDRAVEASSRSGEGVPVNVLRSLPTNLWADYVAR